MRCCPGHADTERKARNAAPNTYVRGTPTVMLPHPHPAVIFKTVSEGAVLLHTESEVYFGLNPVGAQIWELVASGQTELEQVVSRVAEAYPDVEQDVIRVDVTDLLDELVENGLLVPAGSDDASAQPAP